MPKTTIPKVNYTKGEKRESMISPALLQTDQKVMTPDIRNMIFAAAKAHNVTPLGITLLGTQGKMRAYINETGLNDKLGQDGRRIHNIDQKVIKEATRRQPEAKAETTITMFDQKGFLEALKILTQNQANITKSAIEALKDAYMDTYKGIGFASGNSCKGIAYHYIYDKKTGRKAPDLENPITDNINMMVLTRSSNRCKRHISKVGGTSAEEMPEVEQEGITLEAEVVGEEKQTKELDEAIKKMDITKQESLFEEKK